MQSIHYNDDSNENCDYDSCIFSFYICIKSSRKKRQYPKRLEFFLDYLKLQAYTIEEKVNKFYEFVLENPKAKYCY